MSAHTPGPWEVHRLPQGDFSEPSIAIYGDGGRRAVALIHSATRAEANARLIAAAPELLAALEGILEIGKRDMSNPKYDEYFSAARTAIAKALDGVAVDKAPSNDGE